MIGLQWRGIDARGVDERECKADPKVQCCSKCQAGRGVTRALSAIDYSCTIRSHERPYPSDCQLAEDVSFSRQVFLVVTTVDRCDGFNVEVSWFVSCAKGLATADMFLGFRAGTGSTDLFTKCQHTASTMIIP